MKMIIAFAALVAVAVAAPVDSDRDVVVVNETPLDNIGTGDYKYGYALSNGATKEESAHYVDGPQGPELQVQGSWSYNSAEGPLLTKYYADATGFHVVGDHIPK